MPISAISEIEEYASSEIEEYASHDGFEPISIAFIRPMQWTAIGWLAVLLMGCLQGGAELAPVTGRVTLDNEPLANAMVEFRPKEGSLSYGLTNENGVYTLQYTRDRVGARLGEHAVRITTVFSFDDVQTHAAKERVPARYNRQTTLTAEVTSRKNTIDFALSTTQ